MTLRPALLDGTVDEHRDAMECILAVLTRLANDLCSNPLLSLPYHLASDAALGHSGVIGPWEVHSTERGMPQSSFPSRTETFRETTLTVIFSLTSSRWKAPGYQSPFNSHGQLMFKNMRHLILEAASSSAHSGALSRSY